MSETLSMSLNENHKTQLINWVNSKSNISISVDEIENLKPIAMMRAISALIASKEPNEKVLIDLLNSTIVEIKSNGKYAPYLMQVFLRNLCYVGSLQRESNIHKENLIKVENPTGSQMRKAGRVINRWMMTDKFFTEWLSKRTEDDYLMNLYIWVEYSNFGQGIWNQLNTTKDGNSKNPAKTINYEVMPIELINLTIELMSQNLSRGIGLSNIARWLPKGFTTTKRINKFLVGKDLKRKTFIVGNKEVKLNSKSVTGTLSLTDGDVLVVSRKMGKDSLKRAELDNYIIEKFCKFMNWTKSNYKVFRTKYMSLTPESMFSTGKIKTFDYTEFNKWYNSLSMGQQFVVSKTLCFKDGDKVLAKTDSKFPNISDFMVRKSKEQEKLAQEIRIEMSKSHVEKDENKLKALKKASGIKTTGLQTIDLLTDLLQTGRKTTQELNTLHTMLISQWQMDVPVFCILDGSQSMSSVISINGVRISQLDIALVIGLTFMLTNPIEEFRSSLMWFGAESQIAGKSLFKNNAPNQFVSGPRYTKINSNTELIVSPVKTFSENLKNLKASNPQIVERTNMASTVTTFVNLVNSGNLSCEQLPKVLLYITDNEYNVGAGPIEKDGSGFTQIPSSIGWNPLFVFWSLGQTSTAISQYKDIQNCIILSGFSENTLTNLLQGIKKGSLNMYDTLYSVNDNAQFSLLKV